MQINTKIWKEAFPGIPARNIVRTFIADIDTGLSIILRYYPKSANHYRKCEAALVRQNAKIIRAIKLNLEPTASIKTAKERAVTTLIRDIERDIETQSKLLKCLRRTFVTFDALEPAKTEPKGDNQNVGT